MSATNSRNLLIIVVIFVAVLALAFVIRQALNGVRVIDDRNVIFTDLYTFDGVVEGDLVVVAREITLESSARIAGSASLIGSTITVHGRIAEDLTVLGETVSLSADAAVAGDVSLMGSDTYVAGAVGGTLLVNSTTAAFAPDFASLGAVTTCADEIIYAGAIEFAPCPEDEAIKPFEPLIALRSATPPDLSALADLSALDPLVSFLSIAVWSITLTGIATIAVTAFPRQISHIEDAVRARPSRVGGVGIATYGLMVGITLALITLLAVLPPLGLILLPVYLILLIVLIALVLSSLVTLALVVGDLIMRRTTSATPPMVAAVVGSLVLSAGMALLLVLPFGWLFDVLVIGAVSSVGVGAALITRMGTRPLTRPHFVQG